MIIQEVLTVNPNLVIPTQKPLQCSSFGLHTGLYEHTFCHTSRLGI